MTTSIQKTSTISYYRDHTLPAGLNAVQVGILFDKPSDDLYALT